MSDEAARALTPRVKGLLCVHVAPPSAEVKITCPTPATCFPGVPTGGNLMASAEQTIGTCEKKLAGALVGPGVWVHMAPELVEVQIPWAPAAASLVPSADKATEYQFV